MFGIRTAIKLKKINKGFYTTVAELKTGQPISNPFYRDIIEQARLKVQDNIVKEQPWYDAAKYQFNKPVVEPVVHKVMLELTWFVNPEIAMSPAEAMIAGILSMYKVEWYREVSFHNFRSSDYGYYRFDFYIPSLKLVIEYDGKMFHNSPERRLVDQVKTEWCIANGLTVNRYTSKEYYSMATHIDKLMLSYKVYRK